MSRHAARALLALTLALPAVVRAAEGPAGLPALVEEGAFAEAYQQALNEQEGQRDRAFARFARSILTVALRSPDSYDRWFALRAGRILADPEIAQAALRIVERGDRYEQALALEILIRGDVRPFRPVLVDLLESPFRTTRLRAIRGLSRLEDPALVGVLAGVLSDDADPDVRVSAARALAATGAPEAKVPLYRGLDDASLVVREECVIGLARLRAPELAGVLRRRLLAAPAEERRDLIRLIALSGAPALVPDLGPLLADGDPEVRAQAAAAILALLDEAPPQDRPRPTPGDRPDDFSGS